MKKAAIKAGIASRKKAELDVEDQEKAGKEKAKEARAAKEAERAAKWDEAKKGKIGEERAAKEVADAEETRKKELEQKAIESKQDWKEENAARLRPIGRST